MKQVSLAAAMVCFELKTERVHKRDLPDEMEHVLPWVELESLIVQCPPLGETSRPPFAVLNLLCIHFM
ncbi:hypothetical protein AEP_03717 [Curvibacter sp. AEP1-3]|nr:hypothetical protein AEP_03717 [Curvibacter sp. AEP1-3]